jgi:hypothetical protein
MLRGLLIAVAVLASALGAGTATARAPGPGASPAAAAAVPPASQFVRVVDNPYYPLVPGSSYRWRGTSNGRPASDVLTVTHATRRIMGVATTVVHDRAYRGGRLIESTTDWYAQDRRGDVWYFGEATKAFGSRGQVVSREGSWEAGVDGALPGIFMPGRPRVGQGFRQEYLKGHAEDHFTIRSLRATVRTPFVTSRQAMRTTETTPLEPGVIDAKYYVRGVGTVVEASVKGPDHERLELVSFHKGG